MQQFEFQKLELEGAYKVKPFYASDYRGGLIKDYHMETFQKNGFAHGLKEVFYTVSKRGVIRAVHFQLERPQAKLVRCVKGQIYDVIVDLRLGSQTFGKWIGIDLTESNRTELYVPEYFGHGYLVLEDSIVSYKCSEEFYGPGDSGIMYDDPGIGIRWPFERIGGKKNLIISEKDMHLMSLREYVERVTL